MKHANARVTKDTIIHVEAVEIYQFTIKTMHKFNIATASIAVVALVISLFVSFYGAEKIATGAEKTAAESARVDKLETALTFYTQGHYQKTTEATFKELMAPPVNNNQTSQ